MSEPMPFNRDMEEAVLSAMLGDEQAISRARELLSPDDFYLSGNRLVFEAMCGLRDANSIVDPLTLSTRLGPDVSKDFIGYLIDAVPTSANIAWHAGHVRECSERRKIIRISDTLRAEALTGKRPVAEIAAEAQSALLPVAAGTSKQGFRHVKDVIPEIFADFERAINGELLGYRLGFRDIDRATGGMQPGELAFLCGVPGGLKTIFLLTIAILAAMRGEGVAIFSAEMTAKSLIKRLIQYLARVDSMSMRTGLFKDDEYVKIGNTMGSISILPLWIDQTPTPDIDLCRARARSLKAQHPEIKWVMTDFIQLLESQTSEENRPRELTRIAYQQKAMAKELDVACIATCAVDAKTIENRGDKRPRLGDMQWSQGMRQAADLIGLLYRRSLYEDVDNDTLEVDWPKARDLAPFKVTLNWEGRTMRLTDS